MSESTPARSPARLLALLIAVVMAGACAIRTGDGGGADAPGRPGAGSPSAPDREHRADQPSAEDFEADIRGAVGVAEQYWRERFAEADRRFTPIRQIIPYRQEGEVSCGGQPLPLNNAVYCSGGDFIAFDINWSVVAFSRVGDAFLYYLLGHEYAHGIQVRLGLRYEYTIEQELQADCLAGAYLGDSIRANRLTLEDGDIDEFRQGLLAVADDPGQPWFAEGAHGSAEQRTRAFFDGYERSLSPCNLG